MLRNQLGLKIYSRSLGLFYLIVKLVEIIENQELIVVD